MEHVLHCIFGKQFLRTYCNNINSQIVLTYQRQCKRFELCQYLVCSCKTSLLFTTNNLRSLLKNWIASSWKVLRNMNLLGHVIKSQEALSVPTKFISRWTFQHCCLLLIMEFEKGKLEFLIVKTTEILCLQ